MALSVVFAFSTMVSSAAAATKEIQQQSISYSSVIIEQQRAISSNGDITTQGWKTWVGKAALKAVAKVLRGGGKALKELTEELGLKGKALDAFVKHTDDIADVLDNLSTRVSVAEQVIIDTISGVLYDLGVPLSTARTVANVFTFLAF